MTNKKTSKKAEKTRQTILDIAAVKFTQKGYDGAGMREIADQAGVNVALINHYFGSKKALFYEAVIPTIHLNEALDGDADTLYQRLTNYILAVHYAPDTFDPTLAILRSMGSETVGADIKKAFDDAVITPIAAKLEQGQTPDEAQARAAMMVALLYGFDSLRRIINVEAFTDNFNAVTCQALLHSGLNAIQPKDNEGINTPNDKEKP